MGYSASLQKMQIKAYKLPDFTDKPTVFSVYINPEKYARKYRIKYNDVQPQGSNGGSPDFNKVPSDTVTFELVFDGTGVVPSPLPGVVPFTDDGIKAQVNTFTDLVFDYDGKIHSPKYLKIIWGSLDFTCRMYSLDITYTLFKPDGTPLRARANATFISYSSEETLAREANENSPDMSHYVRVMAGDTLPLLCERIYGSSEHYIAVAEVNGLTEFRDLAIGTELLFPPLRDEAG